MFLIAIGDGLFYIFSFLTFVFWLIFSKRKIDSFFVLIDRPTTNLCYCLGESLTRRMLFAVFIVLISIKRSSGILPKGWTSHPIGHLIGFDPVIWFLCNVLTHCATSPNELLLLQKLSKRNETNMETQCQTIRKFNSFSCPSIFWKKSQWKENQTNPFTIR